MFARLIRKAEEREKDERAQDIKKTTLESEPEDGRGHPSRGWDLKDFREVLAIVCGRPAFPWYRTLLHKVIEKIR
jgi:hypothetical protein